MRTTRFLSILTVMAFAALALSACGGGGDSGGTTPIVPTRGMAFSQASLNVSEGGQPKTFDIVLKAKPTGGNVVLSIASSDATEATVSPSSITFTDTDWSTPRTATVTPVDDDIADGNVSFQIIADPASSVDAGYAALSPAALSVTCSDDDQAGITVSTGSINIAEGGAPSSFTVVANTRPEGTSSVTVDIASSDATEATVSPATLAFTSAGWDTPQTVTVTPVDDSIIDGNVTVTVSLDISRSTASGYAALAAEAVRVTNSDNDSAGLTITPGSLNITEGGASGSFTVTLNTMPMGSTVVTVSVTSEDSTEAITFPAGLSFDDTNWDTPQAVSVSPAEDQLTDGSVAFNVTLDLSSSTDSDYAALATRTVAVTVADNDAAGFAISPASLSISENLGSGTFSVTPNTRPAPGKDITIGVASQDTTEATAVPATLVFTEADWSTPQNVEIYSVDDTLVDGSQTFNITLEPSASTEGSYAALSALDVSVTVTDNDTAGITITPTSLGASEGGTSRSFTVGLETQPQPASTVAIDVASTDTTEATVDKATLTFTEADWSTLQTVIVTPVDDDIIDGSRTFNITLDPSASTDSDYAAISIQALPVTVSDNDAAGLTLSATSISTSEGGPAKTFTVTPATMPQSGESINIAITSLDTTEATVSPSTLTFTEADWSTPQTVTVTPVDDAFVDGAMAFNVTLAPSDSTDADYAALATRQVSVTIADDDTAGLTITPTSLSVSEGGPSKSFTVAPNTPPEPGDAITIGVTSGDTTEATVDKSTLTFTDADWSTPQTVTVTPEDDAFPDGAVTFDITLDPSASTAAGYDTLGSQAVGVTTADDESASLTIDPISLALIEGGGSASFTVTPTIAPEAGNTVTVDVASTDTSEATASPAQLIFNSTDWSTPQTVTATPLNDALIDGETAFEIELDPAASTSGGYAALGINSVSATCADNDSAGFTKNQPTLTISEGDATNHYVNISPNTRPAPGETITISITSDDTTEATVSPSTLSWTEADYTTQKQFRIKAVDDSVTDGSVAFDVWIDPSPSTEPNYAALATVYRTIVTVTDDELPSEGTLASPKSITSPYTSGTVAPDIESYYVLSTTAGRTYDFWMGGMTADADLYVYNNDSTFTTAVCSSTHTGTTAESSCAGIVASGGNIYLRVDASKSASGTTFSLSMTRELVAEGSSVSPVDLTGKLPYGGTVAYSKYSYYKIPSSPGAQYVVSLTGASGDIDLEVYGDSTLSSSSLLCSSSFDDLYGAFNEGCRATATGPYLYLIVDGWPASGGAYYTVDSRLYSSIANEGTLASPVNVIGLVPYSGTMSTVSYYKISVNTLTPYTITVDNLTDDADVYVCTDASFSNTVLILNNDYTAGEGGSYSTTSSQTTLYIKVISGFYQDDGGAFFDLRVTSP